MPTHMLWISHAQKQNKKKQTVRQQPLILAKITVGKTQLILSSVSKIYRTNMSLFSVIHNYQLICIHMTVRTVCNKTSELRERLLINKENLEAEFHEDVPGQVIDMHQIKFTSSRCIRVPRNCV